MVSKKIGLLLAALTCWACFAEEPFGTDAGLERAAAHSQVDASNFESNLLISFHQKVLSPTDGPRSHYFPVSSRYMRGAIKKHGFQGWLMGCDRLLRENGEDWVYRSILLDEGLMKYDPVP